MTQSTHHHARTWQPRRAKPVAFACTLALLGITTLSVLGAQPVAAQTTSDTAAAVFQIPAGPLDQALTRFGQQAGVPIAADSALTQGVQSQGVQGSHSPRAALEQLLRGTGLRAVPDGAGFNLQRAPASTAAAGAAVGALPEVTVSAASLSGHTTEGSYSYAAKATSIGKTEQSLRETPQSVTVLTRQLIEDQQLSSVSELMEQAPGVMVGTNGVGLQQFYARGFSIDNYQFDGTGWDYGSPYRPNQDLAMYDSVQVLRGAEGLFSGAGNPGGAVNFVRKRPTVQPQAQVVASAGSWNNHRVEGDISGPLAWDGKLRARIVGAYQDKDFFYHPADEKNRTLYGIVELDVGPATTVTAGASEQRQSGAAWYFGLPRYNNGDDLFLPRGKALIPNWASKDSRSRDVFVGLEHAFSPDWTLKANASRQHFEDDMLSFVVTGSIDANRTARPSASLETVGNQANAMDVSLSGNFDMWGRKHQLVVGADWRNSKARQLRYRSNYNEAYPGTVSLDDFDPNGLAAPNILGLSYGWPDYGARQRGFYGKLQLQATDALKVIGGARIAYYRTQDNTVDYDETGAISNISYSGDRENGVIIPYAGVVYDLNRDWSTYASVTEIHKPQTNRLAGPPESSKPLDPIKGRNYEWGIKGDLNNGLQASFALFQMERRGEGAQDPNYPRTPGEMGIACCYIAQGKIISRGFDAEISGELAPGWQVLAGYTFNSKKNKDENAAMYAATPRHMLKFWSSYQLPGDLAQWTVAGGANVLSKQSNTGQFWVTYADGSWGQEKFNIHQGGYTVLNLAAQYRINPKWQLALNVKNLTDKRYYQTLGSPSGNNWYGEPRSWMVTLRGQF